MESSIQIVSNEQFSVRTMRDAEGTVWFVGKDIAEALEYSESSIDSLNKLFAPVPEIWKGRKRFLTPGGEQNMLCLTEQGVYFFLGRSDKPKAIPYQMWIAGDVVPSIMHTGSYSVQPSDKVNPLEGARYVCELAGITGNQLVIAVDNVYRRCTGFSALETAGITLIAPTQNQLLTPTEIGRLVGLSARRVNDLLAGAGYQHNIAGKWEAIEDGKQYGVLQDTGKRHSDGTAIRQLKWDSSIVRVVEELMRQAEEYPFAV